MDQPEGLQQQIWELVYDLLSQDDAAALRRQISCDPAVARLYADIKLQTELLAEAARLDVPPIRLQPPHLLPPLPEKLAEPAEAPEPVAAPHVQPAQSRSRLARGLVAVLSLAASLLVGYVGWSCVKPRSPLRAMAFQSQREALSGMAVHATVLGPSRLQPRPANHLAIVTRSPDGQPRPSAVAYRLYGDGDRLLLAKSVQTASDGTLEIQTPEELSGQLVRLEVQPADGLALPPLTYRFQVEPTELSTHVNLDKPLCRPGQTVRYRTVTLSRYDLQVREEVQVQVEIRGPDDQVLSGSQQRGSTQQGVFHGEYELSEDAAAGTYRVEVRSPEGRFSESSRSFQVRQFAPPRRRARLAFGRESYAPGEEVRAWFWAERPEGGGLTHAPLEVQAEVDGQILLAAEAATDAQGRYEVNFALPAALEQGQGQLSVTFLDDPAETFTKPVPIHQGDVDLVFFPESGDLVAGVENRVYFRARDRQGKPVHVAGRVTDRSGHEVASARTAKDGRGVFSLVPQPGAAYRLQLDTPRGAAEQPALPRPNPAQFVVLDTGPGVFGPDAPLSLAVRSTRPERALAVTATCRGAVVGQRFITPEQFEIGGSAVGLCTIDFPLAQRAEGVIRVTVYDLAEQPARPLAERLVYRQPRERLNIQVQGVEADYAPGDQVALSLNVRDQTGRAIPATLGIAVVDEALLALADHRAASLTTHFWLTSELRDARGLEDADFYLQPDDAESIAALDLLLGTQGWRRLAQRTEERLLAGIDVLAPRGEDYGLPATRSVASQDAAILQVLVDNTGAVQAAVGQAVAGLRAARQLDLRRRGLMLLIGSLILLIATLLLAVSPRSAGLRPFLPHLAVAAMCSIIGILWISAEIDPQGQVAWLRPQMRQGAPSGSPGELAVRSDRTPPASDRTPRTESAASAEPETRWAAPAQTKAKDFAEADADGYGDYVPAPERGGQEEQAAGRSAFFRQAEAPADRAAGQRDKASLPAADKPASVYELRDRAEGMPLAEGAAAPQSAASPQVPAPSATGERFQKAPGQAGDASRDGLSRGVLRSANGTLGREPSPISGPSELGLEGPPSDAMRQRRSSIPPAGEAPAIADAEPSSPEAALPLAAPAAGIRSGGTAGRPADRLPRSPEREEMPFGGAALADRRGAETTAPGAQQPLQAVESESLDRWGAIRAEKKEAQTAQTPQRKLRLLDEAAETSESGKGAGGGAAPPARPREPRPTLAGRPAEQSPIVREYAVWDLDPAVVAAHTRDATRYWAPLVIADDRGQAHCEFRLPDLEATFRLSVEAHADGRIGSQEAGIISRRAER